MIHIFAAAGLLLLIILIFIVAYVFLMMSIEARFKDFEDDDKCENCERKEFCEKQRKETGTKYCEDYE